MVSVKEKLITKKIYFVRCEKCNKEVIGVTPKQALWNYNIHFQSHIGEKK